MLKGENMRYVYTKKGEERARQLGLEARKAGTVAMFGKEPLKGGQIAKAWEKKGYIMELNSMCFNCTRCGNGCNGTICQAWTGCAMKTI